MPSELTFLFLVTGQFTLAGLFVYFARRQMCSELGFEPMWPIAAGEVTTASDWGCARINGHALGAYGSECVRLIKCEYGYVVQLRPTFAHGFLFLPNAELRVVRYGPQGKFKVETWGLITPRWEVVVYSRLGAILT